MNRILALLLVFSLVGCSIAPDHEGAALVGSGARYVQGAEEWWEHQGEATLSRDGQVVFSGKLDR